MKILVVLGTRPEAVKLAPVIRALKKKKIPTVVCATGQHRELFEQTRSILGKSPRHDLKIMRRSQDPHEAAERIQHALVPVFKKERPSLLVVQGDTTTAAAAAIAAFDAEIPVAHVEAGLRSHDINNPCPEEGNRILIDGLSALHFAPTQTARMNLLNEAVSDESIFVTGNTVVDELKRHNKKASRTKDGPVLVTLHRRESFGAPLRSILKGLLDAVKKNPALELIFPVHPNPSVKSLVRTILKHPRIRLSPPLEYPKFLELLCRCRFVVTDSGGLQEEAACLKIPVLVARDATDRPEMLKSGGAWLIGRKRADVAEAISRLLQEDTLYRRMAKAPNPFGDGRAGERIALKIKAFLK